MALIKFADKGLYCEQGDFYIDPWKPVKKALITHAHADHARFGMGSYLAHHHSIPLMKHRLGDILVEGIEYGAQIKIEGVEISFHPAGHVPGSAQIRLAYKDEVWVISGDYKYEFDGISTEYEPVKCTHFVTESTFGLPVYNWEPINQVHNDINKWWAANKEAGFNSVILGYSFGKAQRILHHLNPEIGEIYVHGAVHNTNLALQSVGYTFPKNKYADPQMSSSNFKGAIIVAPPSALGSTWLRKFKPHKIAIASGWMALRGARRRRNVDRGFVLSDHADWKGLNKAVELSEAETVFVTHGYTGVFSQWLKSRGIKSEVVRTEYEGELSEIGESSSVESEKELI